MENLLSDGGIPVPPLEGLNHAQQIELSRANAINNDPGPSSSIADHFYPCNYRCTCLRPEAVLIYSRGALHYDL